MLDRVFAEHAIEAVLHFAVFIEVGESVGEPSRYYRNNVDNMLLLLDAMARHGIKRLVFSSMAAIFGLPEYTPIDGGVYGLHPFCNNRSWPMSPTAEVYPVFNRH